MCACNTNRSFGLWPSSRFQTWHRNRKHCVNTQCKADEGLNTLLWPVADGTADAATAVVLSGAPVACSRAAAAVAAELRQYRGRLAALRLGHSVPTCTAHRTLMPATGGGAPNPPQLERLQQTPTHPDRHCAIS